MISRDCSSADTGTDAFAIQRSAAAISSGLSVSRRGGLNAQLRSARRITAGSGMPRVFLRRELVTDSKKRRPQRTQAAIILSEYRLSYSE